MGRRWGKTIMGGDLSLATASQGGHVAWIVPTYKNGRSLWRWAEAVVAPLRKAGYVSINKAEREIVFSNGGVFGIYSADNEDSIRGEAFNLVILDEAARIPKTAWTDAIQPTLADVNGDAILISTPKGRNWFWIEYQHGLSDGKEIVSFSAPSSDNPNQHIQRAADLVKQRVAEHTYPERTYRQEWLAEFIDDAGEVFRRVMDAATAVEQQSAQDNHDYLIGVDWGKHNDFTVLTVLDTTHKHVVCVDRFNQIDYALQVGRLKAMAERFRPSAIIAESNSMGEPLIEQLQRDGLPVMPFQTTNASKAIAVEALALAFERGEISIPNDPILIGELQAYEQERLPSGMMRYGAPDGMHDDMVMSLALVWSGVSGGAWYIS